MRAERCRSCGKRGIGTLQTNQYHPFCSERCQRLDLANWFEERYRIPGKELEVRPEDEEPCEPEARPS